MTALAAHEKAEIAAMCKRLLLERGFSVDQTSDFDFVMSLVKDIGKPYLTRELSPAYNDFKEHDSFWLLIKYIEPGGKPGTNPEIIGIIGCRCDDLRSQAVMPYMTRQLRRLYGIDGNEAIDPDHYPPVLDRMSGKIVYIGDFYVKETFRGLKYLPKRAVLFLVYTYASMEWSFDWAYAMIRKEHADIGFITTYCGSVSYPEGRFWIKAPDERDDSEYFVAMDSADYRYLVKLFIKKPEAF